MATSSARTRTIFILAALAAAAVMLAILSLLRFGDERPAERVGQVVLPAFEADVTRAARIEVTTKSESYVLERDQDGWRMPDKGRYPIRLDMLADLSEALAAMTYDREMTKDPNKFDQLGLGDPRKGGLGALFRVTDADGAELVSLIVGFKNGNVFVRAPDENLAWAANSPSFPPLQNKSLWLDLNVIDLPEGAVERVEVEPPEGEPYTLEAVPETQDAFALAPPHDAWLPLTSYAANPPALALQGFAPIDAIPRAELSAPAVGRHRTYTHSGLVIDTDLHSDGNRYWATFAEGMEAESPQVQAELDAIEQRVAGWAFEISGMEYRVMTTPLSRIAAPPPDPS